MATVGVNGLIPDQSRGDGGLKVAIMADFTVCLICWYACNQQKLWIM